MTIQLYCILAGMILPYIWAFSSLPFRSRQFGRPDLNQPRVQADKLEAGGALAVGAQANAWEALTLFAAANVAALLGDLPADGYWAMAAMIWVAARVGHGVFYLMNLPPLRVLSFAIGTGMSIWITIMAIIAS